MGWGRFKPLLAETTVEALRPIQQRYSEISADRSGLDQVLEIGRQRASAVAEQTLQRVQEAMGFARPATAN